MSEVVFTRENWFPRVVREDGDLLLEVVGGADALHDPRTFTVPVVEEHVTTIRNSLSRHLLLYSALLPLCHAAGSRGPLDERAAATLSDAILFGSQEEVDALFRRVRWDMPCLIAHSASVKLLKQRKVFAAVQSATPTPNWDRVRRYEAKRTRG
ncbi:DUF6357 family protein [Streptomyces abyssomicinicus]|uniref:DUF6357 family protein n=1 Tax=Streptomyces abyssomicinicus TaxID=574929 RepID=UPI00124FAD11|nr:DUF6357 family protein [Streptomyces abyssomicinicus]